MADNLPRANFLIRSTHKAHGSVMGGLRAGNFVPKFFSHVNQGNPAHTLSLGLSSPYSFGGCPAHFFGAIQPIFLWVYPDHILLDCPAHTLSLGLSSPYPFFGAIQPIFFWSVQPISFLWGYPVHFFGAVQPIFFWGLSSPFSFGLSSPYPFLDAVQPISCAAFGLSSPLVYNPSSTANLFPSHSIVLVQLKAGHSHPAEGWTFPCQFWLNCTIAHQRLLIFHNHLSHLHEVVEGLHLLVVSSCACKSTMDQVHQLKHLLS